MQEVASEIGKMQKMASEDSEHARSGFGDSENAENGVGRISLYDEHELETSWGNFAIQREC